MRVARLWPVALLLLSACGGQETKPAANRETDRWALAPDRIFHLRFRADCDISADATLARFATHGVFEGSGTARVVARSGSVARVEVRLAAAKLGFEPPLPALVRRHFPESLVPAPGAGMHVYLDATTGLVLAVEQGAARRALSPLEGEYATLLGLAFPVSRLPGPLELALPGMQARLAVTNRIMLTDGRGSFALRSFLELDSEDGRGPRGQAEFFQVFRNLPFEPAATRGNASFVLRVPLAVSGTRFTLPVSVTAKWVVAFDGI